MNAFKFWIQSEDRAMAIKTEFDNYYKDGYNPLTVTQDGEESWLLEFSKITNIDLLHLFHSGIRLGFDQGVGLRK